MNEVIYPDGQREPVTAELLDNGSDIQRANVPLTYLRLIVKREKREYSGKIGVTSALNGMRFNYLKYKTQPDFDLNGSAFMALGVSTHDVLEENTANKDRSEEWLEDGRIIGRSDLLEISGNLKILNDYKVSGSYKVASSMGIVEGPRNPVWDEQGYPVLYQRSGKGYKAGDQKTEKTYVIDSNSAESWDFEMQLNKYRIMYEKNGIHIDRMQIFFIVRDGNTMIAKNRGVLQNVYRLDIKKLDDNYVENFYSSYTERFHEIMESTKEISGIPEEIAGKTLASGVNIPMCNSRESWDGRRCKDYCPYSSVCKMFGDNNYLRG